MPEFDDLDLPHHYRPQLEFNAVNDIDRYTVLLKDGETTATIYPIYSAESLPPGLLAFLCDEFNMEIERGETFPFFDALRLEAFQNYWFGSFAAVMVLGDSPILEGVREWEKECLGTFFIKPNYAGRSSHICTAGFLVNAGIRGKGIGRTLTDCYLHWAPRLGYTYSVFNLVFESNVPARRIWETQNFTRLGRIKSAGILKGHDTAVDAIMYGRTLISTSPAVGAYRFDKIKFYLETGKYPAMADRQEKSRLRSSASHYRLIDGKLLLNGKEVVSDPARQLQICTEAHMVNHGGINKTTSVITDKYHWTRMKDTVATAVKNCVECRETAKDNTSGKIQNPINKKLNSSRIPRAKAINISQDDDHNSRNPIRHKINRNLVNNNINNNNNNNNNNNPVDVDAMVALHNLPNHRDDSLLNSHDLSGFDDRIIAVVEAAQKQQQQQQQQKRGQRQDRHIPPHHSNHEHAPTYAAVAASAVTGDAANQFHQYHTEFNNDDDDDHDSHQENNFAVPNHGHVHRNSNHEQTDKNRNLPVAEFDHHIGAGGEEIEIARALMQSNHDDVHDDNENSHNDKTKPVDVDDENIYFKHD